MDIKIDFFALIPIIVLGIWIIWSQFKPNSKYSTEKLLYTNSFHTVYMIFTFLFLFCIMCFSVYMFLSIMANENFTLSVLLAIVLIIWILISLKTHIQNRIFTKKSNSKEIYLKDINVEYSPAVVSCFINNHLDYKKILSATLLNLCAKKFLKIGKNIDGKTIIKSLKDETELQSLSIDEQYAYKLFLFNSSEFNVNQWKYQVIEEYNSFKFSPFKLGSHITMMPVYIFLKEHFTVWDFIPFITILLILLFVIYTTQNSIYYIAFYLILLILLKIGETCAFGIISLIVNKNIFTKKGMNEYSNWKNFKKFITTFKVRPNYGNDDAFTLAKYLSYSMALGINELCDKEMYNQVQKEFGFDLNSLPDFFNFI